MIHFVGAGSGAEDLITLRGARLLSEADVVIYAGSLVNPALLTHCRADCEIHDSASMTLEEVLAVMDKAEAAGKNTVRLHTGDPSIYGAIREQMDALEEKGYAYDVTPGVSSFCGAAAALKAEYTLPGVSQTVIITRAEGRTPVPEREQLKSLAAHGSTTVRLLSSSLLANPPAGGPAPAVTAEDHRPGVGQTVIITRAEGRTPVPEREQLKSLAAHGSTMVLFLSSSLLEKAQADLMAGGYAPDTPAAIVYKA